MKRVTRGLVALSVVLGATAAGTLPATADDKPVVTVDKGTVTDLVLAKGEACAFAVNFHGEADITTIVRKKVTTTIYSHARARVTNPANHRSETFNASSTFVDREKKDGTLASTSKGKTLFFRKVGFSSDPEPAFLYVRGTTKGITYNPDSDDPPLVFSRIKGTVVNVCDLLD